MPNPYSGKGNKVVRHEIGTGVRHTSEGGFGLRRNRGSNWSGFSKYRKKEVCRGTAVFQTQKKVKAKGTGEPLYREWEGRCGCRRKRQSGGDDKVCCRTHRRVLEVERKKKKR